MESTAKILVTGGSGLVGMALIAELKRAGHTPITPSHAQCDYENREATLTLFLQIKPDYVFHLAAKVGGIQANVKDPVGFFYVNSLINGHVLEACHRFEVKKVAQLGSGCVYPKDSPQPMKEEFILNGSLEPTNEGYALAKISAMKLGQYYHSQYGLRVVCPIGSNIYGPGDTYDLDRAHVLSALVRRFSEAKEQNKKTIQLWGTGAARRQFVHVRDVARGLIFFMNNVESSEPINFGPKEDTSIRELAELIAAEIGYKGEITWDTTKPDGMLKKCLDITKLEALGFRTEIGLRDGIRDVIRDYDSKVKS